MNLRLLFEIYLDNYAPTPHTHQQSKYGNRQLQGYKQVLVQQAFRVQCQLLQLHRRQQCRGYHQLQDHLPLPNPFPQHRTGDLW